MAAHRLWPFVSLEAGNSAEEEHGSHAEPLSAGQQMVEGPSATLLPLG